MKNLKELREYNNLKQKEVAQYIGVSDRVYSYYEKGRTLPAKYVKPLANLFGISCDEFLENDVDLADYTKQVRKEVCGEIRKWCDKRFNWVGDGVGYDGQDYNEMIGSNNTINKLRKFLDQIQGVEDGTIDNKER